MVMVMSWLENVLEMLGDVWDHSMQKKLGKMKGFRLSGHVFDVFRIVNYHPTRTVRTDSDRKMRRKRDHAAQYTCGDLELLHFTALHRSQNKCLEQI